MTTTLAYPSGAEGVRTIHFCLLPLLNSKAIQHNKNERG